MKTEINYLVVFKLEHNKYQVSVTTNPEYYMKNVIEHRKQKDKTGTEWMKSNVPFAIVEKIQLPENVTGTNKYKCDQAKEKTLDYIDKYGIENVRGYIWSKVNLTEQELKNIDALLNSHKEVVKSIEEDYRRLQNECAKMKEKIIDLEIIIAKDKEKITALETAFNYLKKDL